MDIKHRQLFTSLTNKYMRAVDRARMRWDNARKWRMYYEGFPWEAEDEGIKQQAETKLVNFNMIRKYVDAVLGQQLNTKRKISYTPRSVDKSISSDMLSNAAAWFSDSSNLDNETSDVFKDAILTGIGCLDVSLDFDKEPTGAPYARRIDPLEMLFDSEAKRTNLSDCRIMFRQTKQTLTDLRDMFPECEDWEFGFDGAGAINENKTGNLQEQARGIWPKAGEQDLSRVDDPDEKSFWLVEVRWLDKGEEYYLDADSWQVLTPAEYKAAKAQNPTIRAVKRRKIETRRAFLGNTGFLGDIDSPICSPGSFGWYPLTCYRSETERDYYGLIKNAIDPQMFFNQYLSLMNKVALSQSKGGVIIEEGAVKDPEKFEREWAKTGSIAWVPAGALNKIKDKPLAQVPQGFKDIAQISEKSIPEAMGMSPEFVSGADRVQANVLEETRKRSTLNTLTEIYDNLRRFRLALGEGIAYIIQNFVPNGILIRINNFNEARYVEFSRSSVANLKYDVIVDDVPNTVNEKERVWSEAQNITQLAVQYMQTGAPISYLKNLLQYAPLPAAFVSEAVKSVDEWDKKQEESRQQAEQAQSQAAQAQSQNQAQIAAQAQQHENEKNALEAEKIQSRERIEGMKAQTELGKAQILEQRSNY